MAGNESPGYLGMLSPSFYQRNAFPLGAAVMLLNDLVDLLPPHRRIVARCERLFQMFLSASSAWPCAENRSLYSP